MACMWNNVHGCTNQTVWYVDVTSTWLTCACMGVCVVCIHCVWLQDCRNVILIFSVRESGRFQGIENNLISIILFCVCICHNSNTHVLCR